MVEQGVGVRSPCHTIFWPGIVSGEDSEQIVRPMHCLPVLLARRHVQCGLGWCWPDLGEKVPCLR